jgi:hypothetical protein
VDLRGLQEIQVGQRGRASPVPRVRQHPFRAGGGVTPPLGSDIDEALRDYVNASADELRAFTMETCRSPQFQAEVVAVIRMIFEGACVTETVWAAMVVMLRTGIAIERKRHEVGQLKRMYEGGAA